MKFDNQSSVKESESKKKLGAKGPGCALAESSIWGGESTHVDLVLKNSAEFQNLVPEVVCLGSWFQNLIIFKIRK